MKPIVFLGDYLAELRAFPEAARREAGVQSHKVQLGMPPSDWKPMKTVGAGVQEIRVRDEAGAFRVLFVSSLGDAVHVLPAFQKKTRQTSKRDLDVAASRFSQLLGVRPMERQAFETVWDALEDTPAEAANMLMRSRLLIAIDTKVRGWNLTQAEAARRLGITQPRLNELLRGRIAQFSLDMLVNIATEAGLSVRLDIVEPA